MSAGKMNSVLSSRGLLFWDCKCYRSPMMEGHGVRGRRAAQWRWQAGRGACGPGWAPLAWDRPPGAPHSGLSGLATWDWGGRDRGVFLSPRISFWEKLPCARLCRFSRAQDGDWLEWDRDPTQSDGGDAVPSRGENPVGWGRDSSALGPPVLWRNTDPTLGELRP